MENIYLGTNFGHDAGIMIANTTCLQGFKWEG